MKKMQNLSLILVLGFSLTACEATRTNRHNQSAAANVVKAKSTHTTKDIVASGNGCSRGVFMVDIVNDASGISEQDYFFQGKGFFTSEAWSDEKMNPLQALFYDKGEEGGIKGKVEGASAKYLAVQRSLEFPIYSGIEASSNILEETSVSDLVESLSLKATACGATSGKTCRLRMKKKDSSGIYSSKYLVNAEGSERNEDGAIQAREVVADDIGGVSVFTHMIMGHDGLGYGVFQIPHDVEDSEKPLNTIINVEAGKGLSIPVQARGEFMPENLVDAYFSVSFQSMKKDKEMSRLVKHFKDDGSVSELIIPADETKEIKPGEYWVVVKREYLYAPEVIDETGGNVCFMLSSVGVGSASIAEAAKK